MTISNEAIKEAHEMWDQLSDKERINVIEAIISDLNEEAVDKEDFEAIPKLEILKAEIINETSDHAVIESQWLNYESEYYLRAAVSRGDLSETELLHVLNISDAWVIEDSLFTRDIAYLITQNIGYTEKVEEALMKIYPQLPEEFAPI